MEQELSVYVSACVCVRARIWKIGMGGFSAGIGDGVTAFEVMLMSRIYYPLSPTIG